MRWLVKLAGRLPSNLLAQLLGRPVCVHEVVGSIPIQVIPKTLKTVLAALLFLLSIEGAELVGLASVQTE